MSDWVLSALLFTLAGSVLAGYLFWNPRGHRLDSEHPEPLRHGRND